MIDYIKEILGLAPEFTDYDIYLAIICAIGIIWVVKQVISGIYNAVLHIFI